MKVFISLTILQKRTSKNIKAKVILYQQIIISNQISKRQLTFTMTEEMKLQGQVL